MEDILKVDDLSLHSADQEQPFFSHLSFQLKRGLIYSLSGKNGSGKSTLFAALRGDIPSTFRIQGSITIENKPYSFSQTAVLKQKIALISQRYDLMIADQFNFIENLQFAALSHYPSYWKSIQPVPILPSFVKRFGIDYTKPVRFLSGGQRQILALLMALQKNTSLILLDEPTAALDPVNAHMVFQFINDLVKERQLTALIICHDNDLLHAFRTGSSYYMDVHETGLRNIKEINSIPREE